MISSVISRLSALILFIAGLALLFASDALLPSLVPGFPPSGAWLGQSLAAAWIGIAALNWLQRDSLLGGIYGRPTVVANFAMYVVSTLSILRAALAHAAPPLAWIACMLFGALAMTYGALLLRGPFDPLANSAN